MREIDKIHEKTSIILVRILNGNLGEMQEALAKAALKNPILFHDLFAESNQEEKTESFDWRTLAKEGHFGMAVKTYKDGLYVDAWRAIQRVAEYCASHNYFIPDMPEAYLWQQHVPHKKINAIKEFRAIYQPLFPWIDLVTAKNAIESFAGNLAYES